jgi:hypothetical protein
MQKAKKITFISLGTLIVLGLALILLASPLAKYLIEKHDEKYTGRKITLDWAYVNPFTGYIHLNNIKIHESNRDSVFLSANSISADVAMLKLFSKTYELSAVILDQPHGAFIQNKKALNLDDLIERFSSKDSTKEPVHFNFLNTRIIDGEFTYREEQIPINYRIKNVNFESAGKRWDADTIASNFSFLHASDSGSVKGNFTVNLKNQDYRFAAIVRDYDLDIIQQYLKDLTNYGTFKATLAADIKATGNLKDEEDVTIRGKFAIDNFHFGKNPKEDYVAFDKLVMKIIEQSPKAHRYSFDSIWLSRPYMRYERYDYLDNVQRMIGKGGSKVESVTKNPEKFNLIVELARYIKVLAKNFFKSDYQINHLDITNGDLKFNDFSTDEKFSVDLIPFDITADSIDKKHHRVDITTRSGIKPYGNVSLSLSINPKDSSDFDWQYHIQGVPVSLFNPYIITNTSFSLDRGTLELKGIWNVRNGIIKSDNHLTLLDPRTTKRLETKDSKKIPLPLILSFIRERGNVVDYKIPITGNLRNPKFHLGNVFSDLLKNVFVKPPTTPYGAEVKTVEDKIEKSLTWKWAFRSTAILADQEKFIKEVANFLAKTPDASITVHPHQYLKKEKEHIAYFEAKKKYWLHKKHKKIKSVTEDDLKEVDKLFIKDPEFVQYLHKQVNDSSLYTIEDLCRRLVGIDTINAKYAQLKKERSEVFLSYFKEKKVQSQIKFAKEIKRIPYNGFSFYEIEYEGEFPKSLLKAYSQMQKLNDEQPRKKFKDERKKIVTTK